MHFFRKLLGKPIVLVGCMVMVALIVISATQVQDSPPMAQSVSVEDVTDENLEQFAEASSKIFAIQDEAEEQITGLIEEKGLTGQRYVEIVMAENDPEQQTDATEEEKEKAYEISEQVQTIDSQLHQKAVEVIEENGLSVERYQQIAMALQSSPELQERYEKFVS